MALYQYRAVQTDGLTTQGSLEAGGRHEALREIEARGLTPLHLEESSKPAQSGKWALPSIRDSARVPFAQLEDFTRSLSSLLASGVPLSRALTNLARETSHPAASAAWRKIHDRVIDGVSLADAMGQQPGIFPEVYVAMVDAGETGGFLDVVLEQIAEFQSRDRELRSNVMSALLYPAVLLVLAIGVLVYLLVFFIPRFQVLFEGFDAALPLLTQIIVGTSEVMRAYGLVVLAGICVAGILLRNWLASENGKRAWERLLFRLPLFGSLASQIAIARFFRMLGTLLGSGVPMMHGLAVARRSLGFHVLIDVVAEASEQVKHGESLAASLGNAEAPFLGSTLEMIAVAEESGRLDQELIRLAGASERALDRRLKVAVALAEPLMLFLLAGFIGIIFIGMVIPIFSIQDYIK